MTVWVYYLNYIGKIKIHTPKESNKDAKVGKKYRKKINKEMNEEEKSTQTQHNAQKIFISRFSPQFPTT